MFGQGRPFGRFWPLCLARIVLRHFGHSWPAGCFVCAAICAAGGLAAADQLDVRVRIAWGGGEARPWQGTIRLSEGTLSEVEALGLEPDAPGAMRLDEAGTIRISGRTPRSYDGCDVRVQAPSHAKLHVQLETDTAAAPPLELPLSRVVRDFTQFDLDDRGNRLLAQRSLGDALRVSFSSSSLVFSPGEKFELEVTPEHLELASNSTYQLTAALGPARTEEHTWTEDHDVRIDAAGIAKPLALAVPLPEQEGVYDLRLSLYPKRLTSSVIRPKAVTTRRVQVVVVATVRNIAPQGAAWQSILEFDPASPKWWERMARLPSWTRLPTVPRPVESGPAATRTHQGRGWIELAPQAWQAYPLSVSAPGMPHVLEVEYPSDIEQTLGISLIEPNAAGHVGPIGLDSGIDVPPPAPGHKPGARRHRLVFWPQTKTPYVLLVNRRESGPAIFGKIDLQAGPLALPALAVPTASSPTRMLAAYYDKPLFAENFSAPESVDPVSHRGLDDWVTFGAAGERLVQTLQHTGFNALIMTVACEGSAIYPSRLLEPTPKYDSGVFFESGQDPVRKDVLELLFRLCDRSGVVLIPAVQFATPLPALEAIREAGGPDAVGLEPLGPDGRAWMSRGDGQSATGVYYNALDERVQRAMTDVVAELAQRYGRHPSFGGVAVHLNAESFALLPDETCSLDDATFGRFVTEAKTDLRPGDLPSLVARWELVRPASSDDAAAARPLAQAWLNWRSGKIAGLYKQMRSEVVRQRADAKLYLTGANLLSGKQLQAFLRPELPPRDSATQLLPLLGLDLDRLTGEGIVVPRPHRLVTGASPQVRDQERHWNHNAALDAMFAQPAHQAALHFLQPAALRLPAFDAASPFGADKTRTLLISQMVPADAANRERFVHSLATLDASLVIDGGWLLPLGQEAALAPLAKTYRRLPAEPFEMIPRARQAQDARASQELVVRTLAKGEKTFFYVVNPAPWPVTAQVQFAATQPLRLMPYSDERRASLQPTEGGATWTVEMEPFDLVGGELNGGAARAIDWDVTPPPGAAAALNEQIRQVRLRAHFLKRNAHALEVVNSSFDSRAADGGAVGWFHPRDPGMLVEVDPAQGSSRAGSLHLASQGAAAAVWVRSTPFQTPTSGRIQMTARVRIADNRQQPELRLAIEGRYEGQVYYRRVNYGAQERGGAAATSPLSTEWTTCSIVLSGLPLTGLSDCRVGFDLMGDGEVWIDDVRVHDLWLQPDEFDELLKSTQTATVLVEKGRLNECRLFVEGYWPSFLRRHVQVPDAPDIGPIPAQAAAPRNVPSRGGRLVQPLLPGRPAAQEKASPPPRAAERTRSWWTWPWK